ncbi:MAG: hypothetical protein WB587_03035 [Nitrososphaeraceae archaeon]
MEYWCVIWHTGQGIRLRLSHLLNEVGKGACKSLACVLKARVISPEIAIFK